MKRFWSVFSSFFCAAAFLPCAWKFGMVEGLQAGSGYDVFLGLLWLAGAVLWAVRCIRALKSENHTDTDREN